MGREGIEGIGLEALAEKESSTSSALKSSGTWGKITSQDPGFSSEGATEIGSY